MTKPIDFTIVMDDDMDECIYIDGYRSRSGGHNGAADIVEAANGRPVVLSHKSIDFAHDKWPVSLEDALKP